MSDSVAVSMSHARAVPSSEWIDLYSPGLESCDDRMHVRSSMVVTEVHVVVHEGSVSADMAAITLNLEQQRALHEWLGKNISRASGA